MTRPINGTAILAARRTERLRLLAQYRLAPTPDLAAQIAALDKQIAWDDEITREKDQERGR